MPKIYSILIALGIFALYISGIGLIYKAYIQLSKLIFAVYIQTLNIRLPSAT